MVSPHDLVKNALTTRPDMPWWVELVVAAGLSLFGLIYMDSTHTDKVNAADIAVLKAQVQVEKENATYTRQRVDDIYNKLLEWEHADAAKHR